MTSTPAHDPAITPQKLIDQLLSEGIIGEADLVSLLGADRHKLSLNRLELALVSNGVLDDHRLSVLKGAVAGLPTIDDIDDIDTLPAIEPKLSRRFGMIAIKRATVTIAIVEDLELNVQAASQACGGRPHELWLITASQFDRLWKRTYEQAAIEAKAIPMPDIFAVLDMAVEENASDIHLAAGQPVWMRVDGKPSPALTLPLSNEWLRTELAKLVGVERVKQAEQVSFDVDDAYSYGSARFRFNLGRNRQGLTLVARKLPAKLPTMDEIGLPAPIRKFKDLDRGLVLVTGPTGSGKTTTLAAVLHAIASEQSRHIITLEDPIEFRIPSGKSLVNQRELGADFTTFSEALRQALRQDPDVVLVGEMRDLETTRTALTAAETGHLVFGTLHTFDAASTVARMINQFPEGEQNQVRAQLSYILKGVVSQTLVPRKSGKGRVAGYEVLVSNSAVSNNLRSVEGVNHLRNTMATGVRDGMQTMEMALVDLVIKGLVRLEDAQEKARDQKDFADRLKERRGGLPD